MRYSALLFASFSGEVKVDVTDAVGFHDIAKAHESIEDRTSKGKMVLQVRA